MADEIFTGDIENATIAEAKDWLRVRARKGARCPCCKQYVKIYRRPLGSQMARWLIWLVRTWEHTQRIVERNNFSFDPRASAWIDIKKSPVRGGDYAKFLHWDLIEQKPHVSGAAKNGNPDTRDSGMWRPTFKGVDFVYGRTMVKSHVYLYNNIAITPWEEPKMITIQQALGTKYSYTELMTAPVHVEVPV